MPILLIIFLIFDYIHHKVVSICKAFLIKPLLLWFIFLDAFAKYMFGWKTFCMCMRKWLSRLHSSVCPCSILVSCSTSSTILEYMSAHLRLMSKYNYLLSSIVSSLLRNEEQEWLKCSGRIVCAYAYVRYNIERVWKRD